MPSYTPAAEHGLSALAVGLGDQRLENEVSVAELVLGLDGTAFTGDAAERAKTFVALQVNLQVQMAEDGPGIVSESRGGQSVRYATAGGRRVPLDPTAAAGVDALKGPGRRTSAVEAVTRW